MSQSLHSAVRWVRRNGELVLQIRDDEPTDEYEYVGEEFFGMTVNKHKARKYKEHWDDVVIVEEEDCAK